MPRRRMDPDVEADLRQGIAELDEHLSDRRRDGGVEPKHPKPKGPRPKPVKSKKVREHA